MMPEQQPILYRAVPEDQWQQLMAGFAEMREKINSLEAHANNRLMSQKEAAAYLQVTEQTMISYREKSGLPFSKIGERVLFRRSDLDEFIRRHSPRPKGKRG